MVLLRKSALKICSKFTGEHPCRNVISIRLPSNCIEITLRNGCSPVNLLHVFRTPFLKSTSGRLHLDLNKFKKILNSKKFSQVRHIRLNEFRRISWRYEVVLKKISYDLIMNPKNFPNTYSWEWHWTDTFDSRFYSRLMPEAATRVVLQKKGSNKFHKIHRKTPVPESLF